MTAPARGLFVSDWRRSLARGREQLGHITVDLRWSFGVGTASLKAEGRRFDPAPDHQIVATLTCANEANRTRRLVAVSDRSSPCLPAGRRTLSHADRTEATL